MRIVIHAGTHKTGTTSIQSVLRANAPWLAERGFCYPQCAPYGGRTSSHHRFSHDLTGTLEGGFERAESFARNAMAAGAGAHSLIISAEPVYRHVDGFNGFAGYGELTDFWLRRSAYLARLSALFSGHRTVVVLCFRQKTEFIRSFAAELATKDKWHGSLEEFAMNFAPLLDYDRQVELFREHFDSVTILSYEVGLKQGGSVPAFFEAIGCEVPPGSAQTWERRTK